MRGLGKRFKRAEACLSLSDQLDQGDQPSIPFQRTVERTPFDLLSIFVLVVARLHAYGHRRGSSTEAPDVIGKNEFSVSITHPTDPTRPFSPLPAVDCVLSADHRADPMKRAR